MTRKQKPRVCLVMICKDEAAIIRERLRAVLPEVDGVVLVDTGSTDDTIERAGAVIREAGKPDFLVWHEWAGFADARTFALLTAKLAVRDLGGEWWALLLDADTIFHGLKNWRSCLTETADYVCCEVHHGSIRYSHPRLLKLGGHYEWRWRGVLHEYLEIPPGRSGADTSLLWVEHGSGGARSKNPHKFRDDALLLRAARDALVDGGPDADLYTRYLFYEAQSWKDAGFHQRAIDAYVERAGMGGFAQEVYLSWLYAGELRLAHQSEAQAMVDWTRAWTVDPSRAEALVGLATICRVEQLWAPAYAFAWLAYLAVERHGIVGMFADQNVGWRADFELGVAGWYTGHEYEGKRACARVLASDRAPEAVKVTTRSNLELYR